MLPPDIQAKRKPLSLALRECAALICQTPARIAQLELEAVQAEATADEARRLLELAESELQEQLLADKTLTNEAKRKAALAKLRATECADLVQAVAQAEGAAKQARIEQHRAENDFRAQQRRLAALQAQVQIWFGGGDGG